MIVMQQPKKRNTKQLCHVGPHYPGFSGRTADQGIEHIVVHETTRTIDTVAMGELEMTFKGVLTMTKADWSGLTALTLGCGTIFDKLDTNPKIADMGCKYLSRISLPRLKTLDLSRNHITENGLVHLSKGHWPTVVALDMCMEPIIRAVNGVQQSDVVKHINKGMFPSLLYLYLDQCLLQKACLSHLFLSQWPYLTQLQLSTCESKQSSIYPESAVSESFHEVQRRNGAIFKSR